MVVLNKVKGIYRGSALVKSVTVGTRKIWPSRTITGYRVLATITSRSPHTDKVVVKKGEEELLARYVRKKDLMIRVKGKSQMLPVTSIKKGDTIYTDGNPMRLGITADTVCELLEPIYAD